MPRSAAGDRYPGADQRPGVRPLADRRRLERYRPPESDGRHSGLCLCRSRLPDHVVAGQGAFDETILGILNSKDRGQRVEIRVVLHALTAPIIAETCRWIARNLPFVDHVALMGLENTGFAIANDAMLWIDQVDYGDGLARAIDN